MNRRFMRTSLCPIYLAIIVLLHASQWGLAAGQASGEESIADQVNAAIRHAEKFDWDCVAQQWAEIMEKAIVHRENHRRKRAY